MKKLKTFDSSYFIGKKYFEEDGTQNYLLFQPMYRYFKRIAAVCNGNGKDCLMKELGILEHPIIVILHTLAFMVLKQE